MAEALRRTALVVAMVVGATTIAGIAWREGERQLHERGEPAVDAEVSGTVMHEFLLWPGWRLEQIADAARRAARADRGRLLAIANDEAAAERLGVPPPAPSLEGHLAPGRYRVREGVSEKVLVDALAARFRAQWSTKLRRGAKRLDLTPGEIVTLASIVEREAARSSEMPTIAGVFLRRLRSGMPLQSDATVLYAVDTARGVGGDASLYWRRRLERSDLRVRSPYNTYLHKGLPPGPIAAPSTEALRAVLRAAPSPYLYFVAKGNGAHAFARTLREHERNVSRYHPDLAGRSSPPREHVPVQGVHLSAKSWAHRPTRALILRLISEGRVNAVELDLKEEDGRIGFDSKQPFARSIGAVKGAYSLKDAVRLLHARGVRVIGRICVFGDPLYARAAWKRGRRDEVMQTPDGRRYVETGEFTNYAHPKVWRYNIDLATEAARAGVDEILYDYVRRPAGPIESMVAPGLDGPPETAIVEFLARSRKALRRYGVAQGASVFGIAARRPHDVAQDIPAMARVVDYLAPMLYPSLWARGEFGLADPEDEPFQIVSRSLEYFEAVIAGTGAQLLPWLQDYSAARAYGSEEVGAQIDAARLARTRGWLLWNVKGVYTLSALKRVLPRPLRGHGLPQSTRQWELRGRLELWTTGLGARVGIAVKDVRTGETVSLRGDEIFPVRGVEALSGAQPIDPASTTLRARAEHTARASRSTSGRDPTRRGSSRPRRLLRTAAQPGGRTWTTPLELARLLERTERGRGARPTTGLHTVNGGPATSAAHRTWNGDGSSTFGVFEAAGRRVAVVVLTEPSGAAYDASRRLVQQIVRYLDDYDLQRAEGARQRSPFCSSNPFRATRDGPLAGKTIILDPGHGGRDSGARFVFGDGVRLKESHVVLEVALRMTRLLQRYGATVELTRCRDAYVPLHWRADFANRRESADLFVSIHVNGSLDKQTNATEAYYASPSTERVARYLFGTYTTLGLWGTLNASRRLEKGGVHPREFVVLRETRVPSVLTESVYLTNPQEAAALRWSRRGRASRFSEIVRGHVRGILNYFAHPGPVRPAAVPRALRARPSARETARFASLDAVVARLTALGYATPRRSSPWRNDASPSGRGSGSFGFPFGASVRRGRPYETLASDLTDAVYAFQKVQGLPRTGVVDADTRAALRFPHVPAARHASPSNRLEVDKTRQVLYVIRDRRIRKILPISTAAAGVDFTPEGRFSIYRKRRGFDPSPLGTLFQPLYFVGPYAIHGSPSVPPYPASHGCVRVPMWAARELYRASPFGETVYVY